MASGGAPKGNLNSAKHGRRRRLQIGELGPDMWRTTSQARKYRRELETATMDQHGEVDLEHAHLIDGAVAWQVHADVCRWLLRNKRDRMSTTDIMTASREIARGKAERNRSVKALGLDTRKHRHADGWSFIEGHTIDDDDTGQDGATTPQDGPECDAGQPEDKQASDATDAVDGRTGRDEGPATEGTTP